MHSSKIRDKTAPSTARITLRCGEWHCGDKSGRGRGRDHYIRSFMDRGLKILKSVRNGLIAGCNPLLFFQMLR